LVLLGDDVGTTKNRDRKIGFAASGFKEEKSKKAKSVMAAFRF